MLLAVATLQQEDEVGKRVATAFLSSACENFLREALADILDYSRVERRVARALLNRCGGRSNMLTLFKDLTGMSCAEILTNAGLAQWWKAWDDIVTSRNAGVHGSWYRGGAAPRETLSAVRGGATHAFAALHNAGLAACRQQAADA
jgi:hypothetical protein